jgi:hypothetical protein
MTNEKKDAISRRPFDKLRAVARQDAPENPALSAWNESKVGLWTGYQASFAGRITYRLIPDC